MNVNGMGGIHKIGEAASMRAYDEFGRDAKVRTLRLYMESVHGAGWRGVLWSGHRQGSACSPDARWMWHAHEGRETRSPATA
jgi:hypothetical protein